MTIGLVGTKQGMTRVFTDAGVSEPVTVIEVTPNRVTQIKTTETDGYNAIQVASGTRKASRVNKPSAGHLSKAGVEAGNALTEFRFVEGQNTISVTTQPDAAEGEEAPEPVTEQREISLGDEITVNLFDDGQAVDVAGVSKGKGFQGVIKRHNFHMQDATHGNSLAHRAPGSIGQNQTPGRVFKGKKMAGHMGSEKVTTQNLSIVRVDAERNLLLVRGAVPGAKGGKVIVTPAAKA